MSLKVNAIFTLTEKNRVWAYNPLLVRDVTGDYRPANADEVLQAAQRLLGAQLRGREVLSSPQAVRDFLGSVALSLDDNSPYA
jgi:hypothetical protein